MFKIWLTNFGWYANEGRTVNSLDTAKMICRQNGFDARIDRVGFNGWAGNRVPRVTGIIPCEPTPIVSYTVGSGFRNLMSRDEQRALLHKAEQESE